MEFISSNVSSRIDSCVSWGSRPADFARRALAPVGQQGHQVVDLARSERPESRRRARCRRQSRACPSRAGPVMMIRRSAWSLNSASSAGSLTRPGDSSLRRIPCPSSPWHIGAGLSQTAFALRDRRRPTADCRSLRHGVRGQVVASGCARFPVLLQPVGDDLDLLVGQRARQSLGKGRHRRAGRPWRDDVEQHVVGHDRQKQSDRSAAEPGPACRRRRGSRCSSGETAPGNRCSLGRSFRAISRIRLAGQIVQQPAEQPAQSPRTSVASSSAWPRSTVVEQHSSEHAIS